MNRGMFVLGSILIGLGIIFFLGTVFQIDIGAFCLPVALIVAGVLLVLRPNLSGRGGAGRVVLVGDVDRRGDWQVDDAEYWVGVVDMDLDMTQARIAEGETVINSYGFVTDLTLRIPQDVGYMLDGAGFVVQGEVYGRKTENILAPVHIESPNYASASRRIKVNVVGFVVELKIK